MNEPLEITNLKQQKAKLEEELRDAEAALLATQRAALTGAIQKLTADLQQVKQGAHRFLAESDQENLRVRYEDAGKWARHFSEVRMHVASTLLLISLGVLTFGYEKKERLLVWMSAAVWLLMLTFLGYFTWQTFHKSKRQRQFSNQLTGEQKRQRNWALLDFGFIVGLLITIPYVVVLILWILHPPQ